MPVISNNCHAKQLLLASLAIVHIVFSTQILAFDITGKVTGIQDGDTLTVLVDRTQVRVRLTEIDAPESKQAFGNRSKQSLSGLCFQKQATVTSSGKDRYGRVLGQVTCAGIDANAEQVRAGMAWVFDRYTRPDSPLYQLQDEARQARRGLWSDQNPVPPWEWRRSQRN